MDEADLRNAQRWLALVAIGAIATYAFRSHRRGSDTRTQLGGSRGILVDEAITISRPLADVYQFWRRFEEFPRFMTHLVSVTRRDGDLSHWMAKGPAGMTVAWTARIINDMENELIAWQSVEGSTVATAGSVRFASDIRGTAVRVRLQYNPPAGKAGAAIAWLFGEEPRLQVREDLRRVKQLMETGEIATTEGQPSGRVTGWFGGKRRMTSAEAV